MLRALCAAIALLIAACTLAWLVSAQTPATFDELGQVWSAVKGETKMQRSTLYLVPPLALRADADGKRYLFVDGAAAPVPKPGFGLVTIQLAGASTYDLLVDGAVIAYRVHAPAGPGACNGGTGAWAAESGWFYVCVPAASDAPTPGAFAWMRVAGVTTW